MNVKKRNVLVALDGSDHRLQRGVERFALENCWNLSPQVVKGRPIPWGWKGDGILSWLGMGDGLMQFVKNAVVPAVDFSYCRPDLKIPRVFEDQSHAAQLVVEHFLARGFRRFMFFNWSAQMSCQRRGKAFVETLKEFGYECINFQCPQSSPLLPWSEQRKYRTKLLASFLKPCPKPLAVFAGSDDQAIEVLESCETVKLKVPEDIAIVGAGSTLLAPEVLRIPISTVDTNLEAVGYHGARLLDNLMRGFHPPPSAVRVLAARLIVRRSSDVLATAHKGMANGMQKFRLRQPSSHGNMAVYLSQNSRL